MYGLGLDEVARDGAVPWGIVTVGSHYHPLAPANKGKDWVLEPGERAASGRCRELWPTQNGLLWGQLKKINSKVTPLLPSETPSGAAAPWQSPPGSQRGREPVGAVHRGQSSGARSRMEKEPERAKGRCSRAVTSLQILSLTVEGWHTSRWISVPIVINMTLTLTK